MITNGERRSTTPGYNLPLHKILENMNDPRPHWKPKAEPEIQPKCFCPVGPIPPPPQSESSCEGEDPYYGGRLPTGSSLCPCN